MDVLLILSIIIVTVVVLIIYFVINKSASNRNLTCPQYYSLIGNTCYPCPNGTDTIYSGGVSNIAGCNCPPYQVWEFTKGGCIQCPDKSAPGSKGIPTNVLGCNCITGYTWSVSDLACEKCLGGSMPLSADSPNPPGPAANITGCYCPENYLWINNECVNGPPPTSRSISIFNPSGPSSTGPYYAPTNITAANVPLVSWGCYGDDFSRSIYDTYTPLTVDKNNLFETCMISAAAAADAAGQGSNFSFAIENGMTCALVNTNHLNKAMSLGQVKDGCPYTDTITKLPTGGPWAISLYSFGSLKDFDLSNINY